MVADLRDVIEQAKILLLTKNEGNLLQDFIYQTGQISGGQTKLPDAPIDKATAQQHGNQALDGLRTLGTLVLSNGQFRKLRKKHLILMVNAPSNYLAVNDATVLLRDIAGDAAQKTATKINPSEDQLNQIDEPAADNTWHDVPDLSASNLKAQARDQYNKQKPFSRNDLQNAAGDATQAAHPAGSRDPADAALLEADARNQGQDSGIDPRSGANNAIGNLRGTASENVPDETKDKARDTRNRTADYMRGKVPKERRDQTIFRLKKMIIEIQSHSDCKFSLFLYGVALTSFRSASYRNSLVACRRVWWT